MILLVEDNELDRELYGRLLWYNGYRILHAADGESAIALALEARPDLIVLDMILEGTLTGLDVAVRLRSEGVDVPMIALSAVKSEEFGSAIEEAGIVAYLEKPIDPFAVVREVLQRTGGARPHAPGFADSPPPRKGESTREIGPEEVLQRILAAPVLPPRRPALTMPRSSVPDLRVGPAHLRFPKWNRPPSSGFQRPAWKHPPASAPAYPIFVKPGRSRRD